ncbi:MAG: hypothetical protein QOG03_846 [Actinomycetota bacterium]|jgi:hypothetical protein|nr:hypothetical protein [Actinomycetota bacterium]
MKPDRDAKRLVQIRDRIEALSVVDNDNFNLPARYRALVKLETILSQRVATGVR